MQIGFETTAAVPKRLRAVEEQPTQQAMQGERKIRQAPSTDQKKVRRQMQRKTAAGFVPHEHPETEEWHGSKGECQGTMCTSEHNPENQVERAPHDVARTLQNRFESNDEVHVHPDKPNTFIVDPHNTWDGPTHVTQHGDGDFSFDGYQGHSHFGPNAYGGGSCPTCGKSSAKTAANFSAGDCRMCGGNLIPLGRKSNAEQSTMKAQCADCGTKHELQGAEVKKVSALAYEAFQNLPAEEQQRLEFLADLQMLAWYPPEYERGNCPHCNASKSRQNFEGTTSVHQSSGISVRCDKCKEGYTVSLRDGIIPPDPDRNITPAQHRQKYPEQYANTPEYAERGRKNKEKGSDYAYTAKRRAVLISLAGSTWVPVVDTTPYLSAPSMSAIARRAQSVLDTEEIL